MSEISADALAAMFAQETDEVFLMCVMIEHDDLAAPIRLVRNTEAIERGGETYLPFPFELELPSDVEDQLPHVQLVIDNVDRTIVRAIRPLKGKALVTVDVVLASSPDTVERGPFELKLQSVDYNALTVSGELAYEDTLNAAYPKDQFTPINSPGLS
jgi:hypothetical protein